MNMRDKAFFSPPETGRKHFGGRVHWFHHYHQHCHDEFQKHYRYFRWLRPGIIIFNLLILYLLFTWQGIKIIAIFALLITLKGILQFMFLHRLETRIFKPMEKLKQGVDEIAQGNYNIKIQYEAPNYLGLLIASFNEMARQLLLSEKVQTEYEANRKALVANISHDLKTPITAIQGYLEALLDPAGHSAEWNEKYLRTIYHNTVYINRLIDDLFLFSKLDLQKLEFNFEKIEIQKYMDDLMEEYRFSLEEKQVEFVYLNHLEHPLTVKLDRKRFHQALHNIMSNAVKHGPEKDLRIQVHLHQNSFLTIDIQDNGPGIPASKIPFVFDRFYRVDTERTKDMNSTGLGLAIAKELIEAHGGTLSVAGVETKGTCFTISLPVLLSGESEVSA
jgi:signal transduction histidine kinase